MFEDAPRSTDKKDPKERDVYNFNETSKRREQLMLGSREQAGRNQGKSRREEFFL